MRPDWDDYFMQIAELVATRSTCLRQHYGSVVVRDNHILATGYNGNASGTPHCSELGGCLRDQLGIPHGERYELCRSVHSEPNAYLQAAKHGIAINGATLYVTGMPCYMCAKQTVNAGIKRVVMLVEANISYGVSQDFFQRTMDTFEQAGVQVDFIERGFVDVGTE